MCSHGRHGLFTKRSHLQLLKRIRGEGWGEGKTERYERKTNKVSIKLLTSPKKLANIEIEGTYVLLSCVLFYSTHRIGSGVDTDAESRCRKRYAPLKFAKENGR